MPGSQILGCPLFAQRCHIVHRTSQEIRKLSIETSGLVTLMEDGIMKAASGITTIDELMRCLPRVQKPRPLPEVRRLLEGTL